MRTKKKCHKKPKISKTFSVTITYDYEIKEMSQFSDSVYSKELKSIVEENSFGIPIKANVSRTYIPSFKKNGDIDHED